MQLAIGVVPVVGHGHLACPKLGGDRRARVLLAVDVDERSEQVERHSHDRKLRQSYFNDTVGGTAGSSIWRLDFCKTSSALPDLNSCQTARACGATRRSGAATSEHEIGSVSTYSPLTELFAEK
ncbi:hypothetical protein VB773_00365 [Haloarculaceae archaeon H-GB2-1]|nr:hypothetical protein [Haloarculaceae archaeon H-GB2-1]